MDKTAPKKKKPFHWTSHRKEIADLAAQGKEFMEIIALGYGKNATSIVMNAVKRGVKVPEHIEEGERIPEDETGEAKIKPLISASSPKSAAIIFKLGQKDIVLDPLELHSQYRYFLDLTRRNGGISETFSEVLTLGMQVLWVLHQEIPMTENMLRAVFSK